MADLVKHIQVPIKVVAGERWGQLNYFGDAHLICGEVVKQKNENFSFAGGHRVRLFSFKKNVHWRIPEDFPMELDIASVAPAVPPRRKQSSTTTD
jgi:hypothetical protein